MIVYLIGPPCSGKSTLAARYTLNHPEWNHFSIDMCRSELLKPTVYTEDIAWNKLKRFIMEYPKAIVESGLNWRLDILIEDMAQIRPYLTFAVVDRASKLHRRLKERHDWFHPVHYNLQDEHDAIDYTLEHMFNRYQYLNILNAGTHSEDSIFTEMEAKIDRWQDSIKI